MSSSWAALSLLSLRATRARLRRRGAYGLVAAVAILYAFLSMLVGQMLFFEPIGGSYFVEVVWQGNGTHWWDYPGLLAVQPWGILTLPLFATIAMVVVSIGVGIGVTVGVLLVAPLLKRGAKTAPRSGATGAAAGAGPAITGLATLGACCCTSCAGAAGIGVVAAASGASLGQLLLNDWYIGFFQMVVVYVALLAQERSLRLTTADCPVAPPLDRRYLAGAVLRIGLLLAAITWSVAMFVEWGDTSPLTAPAALWYHWIFEHQLLAAIAFAAGMFPQEFVHLVRRGARTLGGSAARATAALAALTWGTWVPPVAVGWGMGGFVNELLGYLHAPAAWGAVPPDSPLGAALYFHWAFQHLLLAGFSLAVAVAPDAATAPLLWTVAGARPAATTATVPGGRAPTPGAIAEAGAAAPERAPPSGVGGGTD